VAGAGNGAAGDTRFRSARYPSSGLTAAREPVPGALARAGVPGRLVLGAAVPCPSDAGRCVVRAGLGPARRRLAPAAWDAAIRKAPGTIALADAGRRLAAAGFLGEALTTAGAAIPAVRAGGRRWRRGRGPPARGLLAAALRADPMVEK
jgi:hypothetical protein